MNESTADTLTDPRPAFAGAVRLAVEVADDVRSDQLDDPTPCTGMDVRTLLDHLGMAVGRVRSAGSRVPLDEWPTEGFSLGDDWSGALAAEADAAMAAWSDDALLTEDVILPWTTMNGAETLGTYVNEVVVHTWDLAQATGQEPAWDDAVVAEAIGWIHRSLPLAERGPMWDAYREEMPEGIPFEPPFEDAVPVPEGAPLIDQLVAWNGRQP